MRTASFKILQILLPGFFACVLAFSGNLAAQTEEAPKQEKKKLKIPILAGERFDLVMARGFLVPINRSDSVPWQVAESGTYTVGFAFNVPIGPVFAFRFEPRATWHKLVFDNKPEKTFPTDSNATYLFEKHRAFYPELGIGFKFNLYRNKKDKVKLFIEAGGQFGYATGSTYKRRYVETGGRKVTEKFNKVPGIQNLRYGAYFRLGTDFGAIFVHYRISDIYRSDQKYLHPDRNTFVTYPKFSPLEIGVMLLL